MVTTDISPFSRGPTADTQAPSARSGLAVTREQLLEGFRTVGVQPGDIVYVASSLAALGLMANPVQDTLGALRQSVGKEGTLVMPAFNFDFCEGNLFDREKTPSRAGILSEAFRQLPDALRTWSPPYHTVVAVGPRAKEIAAIESLTSFGRDSVFQYLHDIGAKHCLMGCGYQEGVAHFHWLEESYEVPYRHWKKFEGEVMLKGQRLRRTFFMYARRQQPHVPLDPEPLGQEFEQAGHVRHTEVGLCRLRAFDLREFKKFVGLRFAQDPLVLVAADHRPKFADRFSPVKRIDHIGIVSRYADKIRPLWEALRYRLSAEGLVDQLGVSCQYYAGPEVTIEFVEPVRGDSRIAAHYQQNPTCPLHHVAFEVRDMGDALEFFKARGYEPLDGRYFFGPKPYQRVMFLSPVQTGGLLVELVAYDGRHFKTYGGKE